MKGIVKVQVNSRYQTSISINTKQHIVWGKSKISFENMTKIKSFQIWLNITMQMMCHYINNAVIQLFYNDSKMTINNLIWI